MARFTAAVAALLAAALAPACGGAETAPSASIVEVTPDSLDPARDEADDLTIRLEYADGDADLGGGVAAVHDCRADGVVVELAIPPLASEQAIDDGVPIEGVLELIVNDVGWIEPDEQAPSGCAELGAPDPSDGEAVFCVVLSDAAGHAGDGDCSPPVAISPPAALN
ncbi:MAG TPA: hypothetical protein VKB80_34350 [Kofleriaceae bacterium]|nr:hypothetical protein [Kofleriaceae bacterium]